MVRCRAMLRRMLRDGARFAGAGCRVIVAMLVDVIRVMRAMTYLRLFAAAQSHACAHVTAPLMFATEPARYTTTTVHTHAANKRHTNVPASFWRTHLP